MAIVGSGSSSIDIATMLCDVCPEVIYSQHYPYENPVFPPNLQLVDDVEALTETGLLLKDGSQCTADVILYCTGFYYSYPFLTADSGVVVDDNYVRPLYKQLINIHHPTMAFIGLHYHCCIQLVIDLQARFCLKYWTTCRPFPPKEEMLKESDKDLEIRLAKGWKQRHGHRLWDLHEEYNNDLAQSADVAPIPPVHLKIFFDAMNGLRENYLTYRNCRYRIVDGENFIKEALPSPQGDRTNHNGHA